MELYTGKYSYYIDSLVEPSLEEIIINSFECEYGCGPFTTKQKLDFARNLSKEDKRFSKKQILAVISSKRIQY